MNGQQRSLLPVGLAVLSSWLIFWEPANFVLRLLNALGSLGFRGWPAVLELLWQFGVAAACAAAGLALRNRHGHAPRLAGIGLALAAARGVQSLYWSVLPSQTMPGDRLPIAVLLVAWCAAWMIYLARSRNVRSVYHE